MTPKEIAAKLTPAQIVSDADVERVHGYANFGPEMSNRDVLAVGVDHYANGFTTGHTMMCILLEHGLIKRPRPGKYKSSLTKKGDRYRLAVLAELDRDARK